MPRFLFVLLCAAMVVPASAQDGTTFPTGDVVQNALLGYGLMTGQAPNTFTGALGATVIDEEVYIGMRLQPDFSIGKFGIGLDIPLLFNVDNGKLRKDEYEDGPGFARLIRYLRYGRKKQDPLYVKLGDISGTTLGFGFIMYQYTNVGSFEKRPIGTEFDLNYEQKFGLEGMWSDFSQPGVIGVRPYVRPLRAANMDIPVLRNLEVGLLYVTDRSETDSLRLGATPGGEPLTVWGADIGLPISLTSALQIVPYAAYARISDPGTDAFGTGSAPFEPGSGAAVGVNLQLQLVANVLSVYAKVERRFFGKHFVGSYFDGVYEVNKFAGDTPLLKLAATDSERGIAGSLYGDVIGKILLGGTLLIPDDIQRDGDGNVLNGAFLRLEAAAPDVVPKFTAQAIYNRNGVADLGDAIQLDERSSAHLRIGYKVQPYLLVGTDYRWTFVRTEENGVDRVEANSYVFPFAALQFNLR